MSCVPHNKCPSQNPVTGTEARQLIEKLCATMKFKKSFISKCFFSGRPRLERYQFYFPLWLLAYKDMDARDNSECDPRPLRIYKVMDFVLQLSCYFNIDRNKCRPVCRVVSVTFVLFQVQFYKILWLGIFISFVGKVWCCSNLLY